MFHHPKQSMLSIFNLQSEHNRSPSEHVGNREGKSHVWHLVCAVSWNRCRNKCLQKQMLCRCLKKIS